MTKISIYKIDDKVTGSDKWIGSDSQTQYSTKNFTPTKLSEYFNENQVIDIGTPVRYKYDILEVGDTRLPGTITFEPQVGTPYSLSSISSFILSKYTLKGNDITDYLNFLIGSNVLIYKANDINIFGLYKINSLVENILEPAFFDVVLTYVTGNGSIEEDRDYLISLISIATEVIPTKTSDLINDGEDGIHPFITTESEIVSSTVITGDNYTIELNKGDGSVIPIEFAQSFRHIQSSNSTSWVIIHNLGFRPSVTIIDLDGDTVNGNIIYNTTNQLTLTFAQPIKGEAYLN